MITVAEELTGHPPSPDEVKHKPRPGAANHYQIRGQGTWKPRPLGNLACVEDTLHGDSSASTEIQREKPWHRLAIEYTLQGLTIKEVADLVGYSPDSVSIALKQPWARERIIQRSKMSTMDKVKDWLENECIPNLEVIKAVRDTAPRPADRKGAAEYLTDRFLGKAVQPVSESSVPATELTKDEIERRLAKLAEGVEAT